MRINIQFKILGLTIGAALTIAIIALLIVMYFSKEISNKTEDELLTISKNNLKNTTANIYKSCEVANQLFNSILIRKMSVAEEIIKKSGGINLSNQYTNIQAVNQFSLDSKEIKIQLMRIGTSVININEDFNKYQPIIDDLKENNYTFTIFQRINEQGDMLRIATNVKNNNGKRAVGTYIPYINPDGKTNSVLSKILSGEKYIGTAFVVNDYYQSIYTPFRDVTGRIIGMVYAGVSLKESNKLHQSVLETVVGKAGYSYVLGATGARKGYYIISKGSQNLNKSILDLKDSKGNLYIENLIEQAIESEEEQISFFNYEDIDNYNNNPPEMLSAIAYFKPFDWIIVSAARVDEIEESSTNLRNGFFKIIIIFFVALTLVLVAVFFVGLSVSKRISQPITESATIMNEIAKGKINNALVKLDELNRWYSKQS